MISVYVGDTIVFEANLTDSTGTSIQDCIATIVVNDASGSNVFTGTATHVSDGTYQRSRSTSAWGQGPIAEYWRFSNNTGTITQTVGNKFRIVGTASFSPYVWPHELFAYYENIEDFFDGSELERVLDGYNFINQQLTTLGYPLPVTKGTDGYYDQALRDWNAWESVYRLVSPRMSSQIKQEDGKPWFDYFKKRANEKWEEFRTRKVVLNKQSGPGKVGIQPGTKIAGTLAGQMESNWEGYGNGFSGADFPRTWRIEMLGTGSSGTLGEGTYRWSKNNGVTWEGTQLTTEDWTFLQDEVYIRFHRGTSTGTSGFFTTADVWTFNTTPTKLSTGGKSVARSY